MRSTATAVNRLSTLAISATVRTPAANAPQVPSGSAGSCMASSREPLSSIRGTLVAMISETTVAATMATSGAGTTRSVAGAHRQATRITITSTPRAVLAALTCPRWLGR